MIQKGRSLKFEKLDITHDRKAFSCGIKSLDEYFSNQVGQDTRRRLCVCYVLVEIDKNGTSKTVIGYYTLSSSTIKVHDLPELEKKKLPKYPLLPSVLIGRLGIDENYQGHGFGELLLMNALKRCYEISNQLGIFAIIVDTINNSARDFYKGYEFCEFSNSDNKLYITTSTVKMLFEELDKTPQKERIFENESA